MEFENPNKEVKPMTPEDMEKQAEYQKGKKILLSDGTIRMVYSVQEEIKVREEDREK